MLDPVLANAGTPLMWGAMLHLVIGNAFIGLLEGLLLGWIYKVREVRAVMMMVLANYISSWAGMFFLSLPDNWIDVTIYNINLWLGSLAALSLLISVALELPFVALALRRKGHPPMWGRGLRASVLVHCFSYVILAICYVPLSIASLSTELKLVSPAELVPESLSSSTIYFIDPSGIQVIESKLDGDGATPRGETFVKSWENRLIFRPAQPGKFQLLLAKDPKPFEPSPDESPVIKTVHAPSILPQLRLAESTSPYHSLPTPEGNAWTFIAGSWAYDGIKATDLKTGIEFHYALETPFVAWTIRDAIHLPGDVLLFQLGIDQICLLNPATKRMALVARGSNPVIVIDPEPAKP